MSAWRRTLRLDAGSESDVAQAAVLLREGRLVAFPTETVYGLGANALDPAAVARIFEAKARPSWDPLIVHVSAWEMLEEITCINAPGEADLYERVRRLGQQFWPGPLTLLLPRSPAIPDVVTAGRERVGVRIPAHAVALALLAQAGVPIAAPSANRFGHTSPTTAQHVLDDLDGRIDAVLDGGSAAVGVESTVLDVCETPMRVYRPGGVSLSELQSVIGNVEIYRPAGFASEAGLPSPGLDLRHYAPHARLLLVGDQAELLARVSAWQTGDACGVMLPDGWTAGESAATFPWGPWEQPEVLAHNLFAGLRRLDDLGASVIFCPMPAGEDGINAALRDRLIKASRSG